MKEIEQFTDDFRLFEVLEGINVISESQGYKRLDKGYKFIGFHYGISGVWISNTDLTLDKIHVKELYKIKFEKA